MVSGACHHARAPAAVRFIVARPEPSRRTDYRMIVTFAIGAPAASRVDRRIEQAAEFAREIDGYARMHGALLVEEALRAAQPEHALVPHVGVDVEPSMSVEAEAHEAM